MKDGRAVRLPRRLDVATSSDVRASLHAALDGAAGDLVIDLCDVEVVDAAGLGVLVGARRRAVDSGRAVVLVSTPLRVRRLLGATHLARLFVIDDGLGPTADVG
jgi:anti-anti-sigma factor